MSERDSAGDDSYQATIRWGHVIGFAMMLALSASWIGLLGDFHWILDLSSHFRWQYLIASAVAAVWTAWWRQWRLSTFAVATLLMNAVLIGQLAWPAEIKGASVREDFTLSVLSINVLTSNREKKRVIDHVLAADADVVFFMEVNEAWVSALQALKSKYPHQITHPLDHNFGLALFSRVPWTGQEILWFGSPEVPTAQIHLTHQGRELVVIGTHPLPPVGEEYATERDAHLRRLAEHVAKLGKPTLVVGDLNATPWSAGMRLVKAGGRLGYRSLSPPWTPTWRAGSIFAIPIDHALCTAPLVVREREVGPDVGSDHRSLRVTMGWEGGE